ncbi:DUF3995 domain-containing protein [Streptomyces sp. NBC_01304]|uniref:DUF3995 domain-containing protein n=1 Tax=Streptomyces sp. NBC_01304 TaxID=2903818 RepID=UPI002E114D2E|nr:DUF3995 domain-containing protein [Streptomyces sp. NBC_01304]
MPTAERTARRAATLIASVLAADAALHLFWATGSTWPAADEKSLSYAVLGLDTPFTPPVLVPLALLLLTASGIVLARAGRRTRVLQLGVRAVTLGLSARAAAGLLWLVTKSPDSAFYWLNLALYTPLCLTLAAAALRVGRSRPATDSVPLEDSLRA